MNDFGSYLRSQIEARWYGRPGLLRALAPLSWLYAGVAENRKQRAQRGLRASSVTNLSSIDVPVIVVGNIVAGGTGKTPVVVDVVQRLRQLGATPGVVARGYGGASMTWPRVVTPSSDPLLCGDEAVELATRLGCPVVVAPDRNAAVRWLVDYFDCTVIVSDDGLQHYPLARSLELAVVDAVRLHGNGWLLPVGPLREPVRRLASVDCVIKTSRAPVDVRESELSAVPELFAVLHPVSATHLLSGRTVELAQAPFIGEHCVALSAIGNPSRFHDDLSSLGCTLNTRVLADHNSYANFDADWSKDSFVVTTAKDAVKLAAALDVEWLKNVWVLNRNLVLSDQDATVLNNLLLSVLPERKTPLIKLLTQDEADD